MQLHLHLPDAAAIDSATIGARNIQHCLSRILLSGQTPRSHGAHLQYDRFRSVKARASLTMENITDCTRRTDISDKRSSPQNTIFNSTSGESLDAKEMRGKRQRDDLQNAQLHLMANVTIDRYNVHDMLAIHGDNWNKLFQRTLTLASLSACLLSALSASQVCFCPCLSVPALLVNGVCFLIMGVVNRFQPSQLAEEQRSAARQMRRLHDDIEYVISAPSDLQQRTPDLLESLRQRLRALDTAFPRSHNLSGGLEKFPRTVAPPPLLSIQRCACNANIASSADRQCVVDDQISGTPKLWDEFNDVKLQRLASQVRSSETDVYLEWAANVLKINKIFAILTPSLAALACLLNTASLLQHGAHSHWTGTLAAVCSIVCVFLGSVSNDLQLGAVFEMYRNAAGHFHEVEESIDKILRERPGNREHRLLFMQRLSYKLGRWFPENRHR
ncbi:hypothetical protein KP509_17G060100 [Ceratopteris richardii]|uniref:Uncharacterized protein n=1 Tax=Ceratopteris richardii TaxID=49495 RepID=A0A8T2SY73_CERRI|nr:hypothetical protein KP509_17G060100 [Ceratopteris richardii]